jgi:tetratricopeptide (TPR) repeat protein
VRDNRRGFAVTPLLSRWPRYLALVGSAASRIVTTATISNLVAITWIVISLAILVLIVQELAGEAITIEPIAVPKALADTGYTAEVASHRLRDALQRDAGAGANQVSLLSDDASNGFRVLTIAARDEMPPDFVVPQLGLSVGAIVSSIRSVLHVRGGQVISGELLFHGKYALRVRVDNRQVFASEFESDNPDDLLAKAAPALLQQIEPYLDAILEYHDNPDQGLLKADDIIAHYQKSDANVQGAYVLKGNHWLLHSNYAEAENMFRKAISSNWSAPIPHNQLGLVLQYQGKSDDAMAQFQRVVGIDPHSWLGYNNIGWVLSSAGKVDQAIANYRHSIELNPRYALAYNNLALALGREGHPDQAIAEYRRAILVEPKYLYAHWNLAAALLSQRDFDGAIGEYRSALDCTKDTRQRAILHTSVGDVLMDEAAGDSKKRDEAIVEYTRALDIDPTYSWAHYNLGLVLRAQGKLDDAITEFGSAVQHANDASAKKTAEDDLAKAMQAKEAAAPTQAAAEAATPPPESIPSVAK